MNYQTDDSECAVVLHF